MPYLKWSHDHPKDNLRFEFVKSCNRRLLYFLGSLNSSVRAIWFYCLLLLYRLSHIYLCNQPIELNCANYKFTNFGLKIISIQMSYPLLEGMTTLLCSNLDHGTNKAHKNDASYLLIFLLLLEDVFLRPYCYVTSMRQLQTQFKMWFIFHFDFHTLEIDWSNIKILGNVVKLNVLRSLRPFVMSHTKMIVD